jgi:hypothetical protein
MGFSAVVSILPLIPAVLITWLYWDRGTSCKVPWHVFLLLYCLIFAINLGFGIYFNFRFNRKKNDDGACKRAYKIIVNDPVMCIFVFYVIGLLIYNIVLGVVWSNDSDCSGKANGLFTMNRVAWVMIFIYICGGLVFSMLNVCCDNCRTVDDEEAVTKDKKKNKKKDIPELVKKDEAAPTVWPPPDKEISKDQEDKTKPSWLNPTPSAPEGDDVEQRPAGTPPPLPPKNQQLGDGFVDFSKHLQQ